MGKINCGKVALGGIVTGVILNAIDFVVNGVLLGAQWTEAVAARGIDHQAIEKTAMAGWITFDLFMGFFLVWFYAAIRPRYGAGPKTAARACLALWLAGTAFFLSYWFMGMVPLSLVLASSAGGLVSTVVAGMTGCWLYKEPS